MTDVAQAPLGAEPVVSSGNDSSSTPPNTPSVDQSQNPVEINPDGFYKIPGVDKPVKFSDHVRGFQSQATKASQRAAELERKLQEREASISRYEQEARQRQQPQNNPGQPGVDPYAEMRALPYLSGQDAANVVQSIAGEFNVRDQIIIAALKQIQSLQQIVKPMYSAQATQSFDSKIAGWVQAGGYPEEYLDLAKEIYLGYEPGPDLDEAFPRILQERFASIEAALEKKRRMAADNARRAPFVPGKGGQSGPSRPMTLRPGNTARQDVDALWDSIQVGSGT